MENMRCDEDHDVRTKETKQYCDIRQDVRVEKYCWENMEDMTPVPQ